MNNIKLFEGQEIQVKTDKGNTLINLVHMAKACGLIKNKTNGTMIVNWKSGSASVCSKLNLLSSGGSNNPPQHIVEIQDALDEIENTDDRNSIYISSWLAKRIALECHSEKANKFKNFLVELDEKRENGELETSNQQLTTIVTDSINAILPTLISEMTNKLIPTVIQAKQSVEDMKSLMNTQIAIHDNERDELKEMIGMQSRNTKELTDKLKYELEQKYGERITAKDTFYINAKNRIFSKYRVSRWEQIPVLKYSDVFASIEELFYE